MAKEAERLLDGTGWLPEPLRTGSAEQPSADAPTDASRGAARIPRRATTTRPRRGGRRAAAARHRRRIMPRAGRLQPSRFLLHLPFHPRARPSRRAFAFWRPVMPIFTIETTYRLPVYRQRTYEADTLEDACGSRSRTRFGRRAADIEMSEAIYVTGIWQADAAYRAPAPRFPRSSADDPAQGRPLRGFARRPEDPRPCRKSRGARPSVLAPEKPRRRSPRPKRSSPASRTRRESPTAALTELHVLLQLAKRCGACSRLRRHRDGSGADVS